MKASSAIGLFIGCAGILSDALHRPEALAARADDRTDLR